MHWTELEIFNKKTKTTTVVEKLIFFFNNFVVFLFEINVWVDLLVFTSVKTHAESPAKKNLYFSESF